MRLEPHRARTRSWGGRLQTATSSVPSSDSHIPIPDTSSILVRPKVQSKVVISVSEQGQRVKDSFSQAAPFALSAAARVCRGAHRPTVVGFLRPTLPTRKKKPEDCAARRQTWTRRRLPRHLRPASALHALSVKPGGHSRSGSLHPTSSLHAACPSRAYLAPSNRQLSR